jgi:hypothetical protein
MKKISQHLYTRERRGLYKNSVGFDTIAKSKNLSDSFIKEKIHPYCVYSGGGANALTVAHFRCGKMLIGQAVHVPADFTGQRTAFFMHNYILPAAEVGEMLSNENFENLLHTDFKTSYDISLGGELDELEILPKISSEKELFVISEEIITHIANRAIESVEKSKKTYVLVENAQQACAILSQVYAKLTDAVKHILGFCTFSREPRKNTHLIFLDKESFRKNDSRFANDFIIDLSEKQKKVSVTDFSFSKRIAALSPAHFFSEIEFWFARIPSHNSLNEDTALWLDKNLEKLSPQQFAAIPSAFIRCGKNTENPSIYVQISILKTASAALLQNRELDLRYLVGSYFLSHEARERTRRLLEVILHTQLLRSTINQ